MIHSALAGRVIAFYSVIPSEAAQGAAQSRDLFMLPKQQNRSLHYASLRSAPVGMTEFFVKRDGPAFDV
jgi:hypothetical protein